MTISNEEIKTLARLCRLDFDDEKCKQFAPEFEEIIQFANRINEQVEGDTATIREVTSDTIALENLRPDDVKESLPNEKILSNVVGENGYFSVKRVVK